MKMASFISSGLIAVLMAVNTFAQASGQRPGFLEGTWRLSKFQSPTETRSFEEREGTARFEMYLGSDGRTSLRLDCNRANGTWKATAGSDHVHGRFSFGSLSSSRALCAPPRFDEFFLKQAEHVAGYAYVNGELHISLKADAGSFVWTRLAGPASSARPVSVEAGGPRNWRINAGQSGLNLREEPSEKAPIIGAYPSGTLWDNLGCVKRENQIWCDVQQFGGGKRGYVSAKYLKAAVSPNGHVIYGEDLSALRAGRGQFDAQGEVKCAQGGKLKTGACAFKVARDGGGYATLVLTSPAGEERVVYFRMGLAIGVSQSEANRVGDFAARRAGDATQIEIGDETYQLPDSIVLGG